MKKSPYFLSAAIAGIAAGGAAAMLAPFASASSGDAKDDSKKVKCYNSCTGRGACKTATHACKGQNGCEGDGKVTLTSADACTKSGGLLKKPKTPAFPMPAPPKAGT